MSFRKVKEIEDLPKSLRKEKQVIFGGLTGNSGLKMSFRKVTEGLYPVQSVTQSVSESQDPQRQKGGETERFYTLRCRQVIDDVSLMA